MPSFQCCTWHSGCMQRVLQSSISCPHTQSVAQTAHCVSILYLVKSLGGSPTISKRQIKADLYASMLPNASASFTRRGGILAASMPAMGFTILLLLLGSSTAFEYGELASFVRRHGGRVHRSLALADPAPCGSRRSSAQPIPETDARTGPLVVVPASLEINAARARTAMASVPGIGELDNGAVVVLWLAALDAERRRSREDTFWGPYLRSLPQDILELPNGWAPLISGDSARYEALLDAAARATLQNERRARWDLCGIYTPSSRRSERATSRGASEI